MEKIRSLIEKEKKKGQGSYLPFLLFGIVIVVIFAIVAVPSATIFDKASNELMETDQIENDSVAYSALDQIQSLTTPLLDQLVFVTMIAVMFGTFMLALFTDFHPATVVLFILAVIIFIIVGGLLANVWDEISSITTGGFAEKSAEMPLTNSIMGTSYPIIIGVMGVIAILIILHKRGTTQGA